MGEKTEKATPKRRRDERKKGNVCVSKDAVAVVSLFAAILVLRLTFTSMAENMADYLNYCFELVRGDIFPELTSNLLIVSVGVIARCRGAMMGVIMLAAVVSTMAQTQLLVTAESMKPKFSRINPLQGIKRLFSLNSLVMTLMNLVKIILLMVIIYMSLRDLISVAERYMYADIGGATRHMLNAIFSMVLRIAMAFLVLAAVDFMYQHWDYEKKMRMSKQEIKEEYKQTEGDPQIKGKIKQMQRQMAQSRMMSQVPGADVVVRNPTHVAVALRYHAGEDTAPIVLAMGVDYVAQKIVEVAEANDIIVMENVPLARALYAEAELNRPIPPDLYEAVAEVMVYLYKLGRIQA